MKNKYSLLVLVLTLFLAIRPAHGQDNLRDKINSQRIAFLTSRINLTPEEAQKFWPVYNVYYEKRLAIWDEKEQILKKFKEKTMADAEMDAALVKYSQLLKNDGILMEEFTKKFRQILSPKKVIKLYVAQDEFTKYLLQQIKERNK
jgi:hypothetical protein